ncbi:hypothetical protein QF042_003423 [Pedobacter sp. W3I1]|nr:hypothetical protein [Pedobacter sp. W3I1]
MFRPHCGFTSSPKTIKKLLIATTQTDKVKMFDNYQHQKTKINALIIRRLIRNNKD